MIGLFIGSFNPPTLAHFEICLKLSTYFQKIVLVPVNSKEKNLINLNHRINMLNILKKKYSFLEVDSIMQNHAYLNYQIIDLLQKKYHDIKLIIGSDLLDKLVSFDNYEYLLQNYFFIVMERIGYNTKKIIDTKYFNYQDKFSIIDFHNDISSTIARDLLKNKQGTDSVLDKDVYKYIIEHELY